MPNSNIALVIPARVVEGDFAGWLSEAMAARRMSHRMLQVRSGLDHTTIYRLAAGQRQPTLPTALALLRILGGGPGEAPLTNGHEAPVWPPDPSLLLLVETRAPNRT